MTVWYDSSCATSHSSEDAVLGCAHIVMAVADGDAGGATGTRLGVSLKQATGYRQRQQEERSSGISLRVRSADPAWRQVLQKMDGGRFDFTDSVKTYAQCTTRPSNAPHVNRLHHTIIAIVKSRTRLWRHYPGISSSRFSPRGPAARASEDAPPIR